MEALLEAAIRLSLPLMIAALGLLIYAGLFLLGTIANYLQVVVLTKMGLAIVTYLKKTLFHHLMGLSLAYFDQNSPGTLMARVESDAEPSVKPLPSGFMERVVQSHSPTRNANWAVSAVASG